MAVTANEYINIYKDNVTQGGKDGTLVSQNDLQSSPIEASLDATNNEEQYVKCAIRTQPGYKSTRTSISFVGQTQEKWQVAKDENFTDVDDAKIKGLFKRSLVLSEEVIDKNTIFWVRIMSSSDEHPRRDMSVSLKVDSYIVTV